VVPLPRQPPSPSQGRFSHRSAHRVMGSRGDPGEDLVSLFLSLSLSFAIPPLVRVFPPSGVPSLFIHRDFVVSRLTFASRGPYSKRVILLLSSSLSLSFSLLYPFFPLLSPRPLRPAPGCRLCSPRDVVDDDQVSLGLTIRTSYCHCAECFLRTSS